MLSAGSPGTGSPLTAEPTSRTPRSSRENTATTAVAASIPTIGTGQVGRSREPTIMPTSRGSASATVGRCASPSPVRNDATSARVVSPSTGTPVTLSSWPTIMMTEMPAM